MGSGRRHRQHLPPACPELQKHLGQPIVIANVTGASGTVGAREAKNAPPDGYTLYAVHDYIHLTFYAGLSDVRYSDFEPICLIAATPSVLTASAKTPWKNWAELADGRQEAAGPDHGRRDARARRATSSRRSIEKAAGIKFKYVSYDGLAPRMNALLGGHIDLTDSNLTQKGKVDAGLLRFLAIASEKRDPEIPDVPTLEGARLQHRLRGRARPARPEGHAGAGAAPSSRKPAPRPPRSRASPRR